MAELKFIGIDNVVNIANQLEPNIIMGPAYFKKAELSRLAIKVITGVQFKKTAMVLSRKGGTSRRKKVGVHQESKIGYLMERELVAHIVWNRFRHNEDEFQEKPIAIAGSANFHYPLAEEFITEIGKEFSDDVYANLFFGDENSDDESLNYYNGFHTIINNDMAKGLISEANGNLIPCAVLDAPQSEGDSQAWDEFVKWHDKWPSVLQDADNVIVYLGVDYGNNISDAYEQKHRSLKSADFLDNGNFKIARYPNITFAPTAKWGNGTRMVATIPGNFELGVNSEGQESFVAVQHGSDEDVKDIIFQIQGIYGCRILDILKRSFVTNGGTIEAGNIERGDYEKDAVIAIPNDAALGSVAITNGSTPVESGTEVAKGVTLTLTATPKTGKQFVKWSNGSTANPTSIVTTGDPIAIVGIFSGE